MTRHARAGYVEPTLETAGMICSENMAHKDLRSSEIRCGEKDIQTLITALYSLINPFEVEVNEAFLLAHEPKMKLRTIY